MRTSKYTAVLLRKLPPEIAYRIRKVARAKKKSFAAMLISFLERGVNT